MFTNAFAREEESKKGTDAAQLTGATSSYARKYALSGLFALDDTKDSDFTNTGDGEKKQSLGSQIASIGESSPYVCAECGKPFTAFTDKNGRSYTAQEVWESVRSRSADGIARCKECREKAGAHA
jgi:DNA-directed RNA polymerase subunit RPC12/RpoP